MSCESCVTSEVGNLSQLHLCLILSLSKLFFAFHSTPLPLPPSHTTTTRTLTALSE